MHQLNTEPHRRTQGERGIALLAVLTALAVLTIVATDMQYNARIDATLAENGRDELIAYYNAKTALEMELAILRAVRQAQATVKQLLPALPLPNLVSMIPTECGLLGELITLADGETPLPVAGGCTATPIAEKGKIDVNRLGSVSEKFRIRTLLAGRFMDPRFDRYFEEANSAGERVLRDELVGYLGDYVDLDNVKEGSTGQDEDDIYARQRDRYKVKNAPFDSVAELQLVYGIGDELFRHLRESLTVYPVGGVTLATADLATVVAIVRQAAINPNDPALWGEPMFLLVQQIAELRKLPMAAGVLNGAGLVALAQAVGIGLDGNKLKDLTDENPSLEWYTVQATGQAGAVEKRITATFNFGANQMVYYREE